MVTETDAVAAALDEAARRWPDEAQNRSRLLVRLIETAHACLLEDAVERRLDWAARVAANSGALNGCYPPGCLEQLREDWPA